MENRDLLAIVEVTYNVQELLDFMSNLGEDTRKRMLYNFFVMRDIEGNYFITKDHKLIPASLTDIEGYKMKLLTIEAKIKAEISTFDYLIGKVMQGKRVKPHAHVRDGKGILDLGTILNFD